MDASWNLCSMAPLMAGLPMRRESAPTIEATAFTTCHHQKKLKVRKLAGRLKRQEKEEEKPNEHVKKKKEKKKGRTITLALSAEEASPSSCSSDTSSLSKAPTKAPFTTRVRTTRAVPPFKAASTQANSNRDSPRFKDVDLNIFSRCQLQNNGIF